jgi:hypothetical protein
MRSKPRGVRLKPDTDPKGAWLQPGAEAAIASVVMANWERRNRSSKPRGVRLKPDTEPGRRLASAWRRSRNRQSRDGKLGETELVEQTLRCQAEARHRPRKAPSCNFVSHYQDYDTDAENPQTRP